MSGEDKAALTKLLGDSEIARATRKSLSIVGGPMTRDQIEAMMKEEAKERDRESSRKMSIKSGWCSSTIVCLAFTALHGLFSFAIILPRHTTMEKDIQRLVCPISYLPKPHANHPTNDDSLMGSACSSLPPSVSSLCPPFSNPIMSLFPMRKLIVFSFVIKHTQYLQNAFNCTASNTTVASDLHVSSLASPLLLTSLPSLLFTETGSSLGVSEDSGTGQEVRSTVTCIPYT
jgi:hypothetical protein